MNTKRRNLAMRLGFLLVLILALTTTLGLAQTQYRTASMPVRARREPREPLALEIPASTPSAGALVNGDFESGPDVGWVEYSTYGWALILETLDLPVTPHSGNWAAWLGGDDNEIAHISQPITIPSGSPALRYWYWINSADICGYDYAWVRINSTSIRTFDLCEDDNTAGWVEDTIDLSSYAGQSVTLEFRVETDFIDSSNYFVDDVSIEAGNNTYLPLTLSNYWTALHDDFSNPNSGWDISDTPESTYGYVNGEYQILVKQPEIGYMVARELAMPADYRMEISARLATTTIGSYGVLFEELPTPSGWEGYVFIIHPDAGEFRLEQMTPDIELIDWTYSSAIERDMGTNRIRVDRTGSRIEIYINGTRVVDILDGTFTGPGRDVGLAAYAYETTPADARFDDFAVVRR